MRIVGIDVTATREVSTGDANNHFVFDHERRRRDCVGVLEIADHDVPEDFASLPVQCHEVCVESAHVQPVTEDPKAAVDRPATDRGRKVGWQPAAIAPHRTARAPIDRPRLVVVPGHVQNAVDNERRVFEAAPGEARHIGLEHPLRDESRDILRRQLFQRAVPLPSVIARKRQPARGIL